MKRRGIIKGQTIILQDPIEMTDGQHVEVDVHPLEDAIEKAKKIRNKLEKQWGGRLNRSLDYIREDRDR